MTVYLYSSSPLPTATAPANRHESGDAYALDLGGTNFRVLYVQLSDKKSQVVSKSKSESINHNQYCDTFEVYRYTVHKTYQTKYYTVI